MKTQQRFSYTRNGEHCTFLMLPSELRECQAMLSNGLSLEYVFDRVTGYDPEGVSDIKIQVTYLN